MRDLDKQIRLDKYLFFVRIFKSRNIALKAISKGNIKIDESIIKKPHKRVKIGDILTIEKNRHVKKMKILQIPNRRESFEVSSSKYEIISSDNYRSKDSTINVHKFLVRSGRPTKNDRRKIDKLMSRY